MKMQKAWDLPGPNSYWWRPIRALDSVCASANHRPQPQLGKRVSQSSACIHVSHQMSKHCGTLPYSPDCHDTQLAHASFHSHFTSYMQDAKFLTVSILSPSLSILSRFQYYAKTTELRLKTTLDLLKLGSNSNPISFLSVFVFWAKDSVACFAI